MKYSRNITLKDGRECCLRNGTWQDGQTVSDLFVATHGQTDYLLAYPEEHSFTVTQECEFLEARSESENQIMLLAVVDGAIVGTAGIEAVGRKYKVRHRAEFGISVDREYWGLGIGRALMDACIECAKKAGYLQLELDVVADNDRAIALYKSGGFTEYGRNPKGFQSRMAGFQELVYMRLELT